MSGLGQHHADAGDLFVGRGSLLAEIAARTAAGSHILLDGPAGVGKSRLAAELVRDIRDRPVELLLASRGTARHPLGMFAAHGHLAGVGPGDVASLFDRHLRRWRTLSRRSGVVVVWVDDIHHADDLSASLLRQAAAAGLIQLVATARTGAPLAADIEALVEAGALEIAEVPPLAAGDTAVLARAWAPGPLTSDQVAEVQRLSDGHPLFVRELVRDGYAHRGGHGALAALVAHRLSGLSGEARRVATMIAVAEPVHHGLFEADGATLRELIESGLVTWTDSAHLRIEHPYYSAALADALGPLRAGVYADLVGRARDDQVDPVLLAEWMLEAGRPPDALRAEHAARHALGRGDTGRARRFADHAGDAADLLRAEALVADGDLVRGLDMLADLRRSQARAEIRVEAASLEARQRALTLSDYAAAHRILTQADRIAGTPQLRRPLLLARTWLWMFGAVTDDAGLWLAEEAAPVPGEPEWVSFEIVSGAGGVLCQLSPAAAAPLVRAMLEAERTAEHDDFVWARTRGLEGTFRWHEGRAEEAFALLARAAADPRAASHSAAAVIAGNLSLAAAMTGRFGEAAAAARRVRDAKLDVDPYRFDEIARLVHVGNHAIAGLGPDPAGWPAHPPAGRDVHTIELMMSARARVLRSSTADIDDEVRTLIDSRARGWLALLYADVGDGRRPRVDAMVRDAYADSDGFGLWGTVFALADARVRGDADALLDAALRLLGQGFVGGASRALADVVRSVPASDARSARARQGIARALRRWHAPRPEWLEGIELPSPRQLDAVELLIAGCTVAQIADGWSVSRRTVENHVYRAAHALGVSGMDELVRILGDPSPERPDE